MNTAVIDASALSLVLATRKIGTVASRWCVMSAHVVTQPCRPGRTTYRLPMRSMAQPMSRGDLFRVIDREAACGARQVRATFGTGVRALRAESPYLLPKEA